MVIAHHIILTRYGHWLPNDPRGSMSAHAYIPQIAELGESHFGRREKQPSRRELCEFHREASCRLAHPVLWWNDAERQAIALALGTVVREEQLTCYACAVLANHAHLLIRKHRLKAEEMSTKFKDSGRRALVAAQLAPPDHPVFSADPCHIYKSDPKAVRTCIRYINENPQKHNLPQAAYPFLKEYDEWPFHGARRA